MTEKKKPAKKTKKREAKQHSTREAKHVQTLGDVSTKTRETHPHLFFSSQRYGARPKVYPRRPIIYVPCKFCDRVLTDTGSQAVVTGSVTATEAYLHCRMCFERWKMPRARSDGR